MKRDTVKSEERAKELLIDAMVERHSDVIDCFFQDRETMCECGITSSVCLFVLYSDGTKDNMEIAICDICGDDSNGQEIIY